MFEIVQGPPLLYFVLCVQRLKIKRERELLLIIIITRRATTTQPSGHQLLGGCSFVERKSEF